MPQTFMFWYKNHEVRQKITTNHKDHEYSNKIHEASNFFMTSA